MPSPVYRFRPVSALLGEFKELERQEIYFAPPSELNDPYDGATEVQWKGDEILWTNLLNHYLLCTVQAAMLALARPDVAGILDFLTASGTADALPTAQARELYCRVKALFYALPDAGRLPGLFAGRPEAVRRDELKLYLRVLHREVVGLVLAAMAEISGAARTGGSAPQREAVTTMCCRLLEALNSGEQPGANKPGYIGGISEELIYEQQLLQAIDSGSEPLRKPALTALLIDFPSRYVSKLEKLLYNDWFTACFVDDVRNTAMWGVYGDHHRGVALKFRTQDAQGDPALLLHTVTGVSGGTGSDKHYIRSYVPHVLHSVHYSQTFPHIDFFLSMGRITGAEERFWHYDEAGRQSPRCVAAEFSSERWRKRYWDALIPTLTTKHRDWVHERERRILLSSSIIDLGSNKEHRKLVYRFEDLEGIVFGARTPIAEVVEIVRLVRAKCRRDKRADFEFSRAGYSPTAGTIIVTPMSQLSRSMDRANIERFIKTPAS